MKKLQFSIDINAPKEKVWDALWNDANYRKWTAAFQEGSYYESDLKQGSEILFLSPDKNGMFGVVEEVVPFEKMYFLHKGEIQNGEKQAETYDENAVERYDLVESGGKTELTATMNAPEDYIPYFADVFPIALEKVKDIAENS